MNLVLVESPTKAKTLTRFLGEDFVTLATYGHIRDLPEKKLGLTLKRENGGAVDFEPEYVVGEKQKTRVKEIEEAVKKADRIYLATDPDREGEAIAFHIREVIKADMPAAKDIRFDRVAFHEITRQAIDEAIARPRKLDDRLVDAQQARRILDRLVGYKLSPLLWRKVRKGLSAGRVQSVAVRLVVEREKEIAGFVPEEYWDIFVQLKNQKSEFKTKLTSKNGSKFQPINAEQAAETEKDLRNCRYTVNTVEKRETKKTPPPPFTTSTLQQTAANKFGWTAKKTMQIAQALYEEGNITYHRTDSTNLAAEAVAAAGKFIAGEYGPEYALSSPRFYKTKSKVAQEAHEAIRPTEVSQRLPADGINHDQEKLYGLIRNRFLACQMAEAKGVSMKIGVRGEVNSDAYGLEAKGETISFDGWMRVYGNSNYKSQMSNQISNLNEQNGEDETVNEAELPEVQEGEEPDFVDLTSQQKFTQPPARYNDAGLIKALEEKGIGRPSTYAPILTTIQDRQYVERVEKRFKPTALGEAANEFLVVNFPKIVDYGFTAGMEENLDEIASGDREWRPVLAEFFRPFEKDLETAGQTAERVKVEVETTGEKCPKCETGEVVVRIGRFGKFLACSRYPECDYKGNYQEKIGVMCPKCGGDVIMKRTKSRKNFFGCSNYPKCDFASWTKPKDEIKEKSNG